MQKVIVTLVIALAGQAAYAETASLLVYRVLEQGIEPYLSRILVTPGHVRVDEGIAGQGYTLFDREQGIIYNVSDEDRSVLEFNAAGPVEHDKNPLILNHEVTTDPGAPMVGGVTPQHVILFANGDQCLRMTVAEGLMGDAMQALREFRQNLARVHQRQSSDMPLGEQTACDLAINIYAPTRNYDFGLPIVEQMANRVQTLVDFDAAYEADAALFELPDEYGRGYLFAE